MIHRGITPNTDSNPTTPYPEKRDFYRGFRQATLDFARKYERQTVPIDETQITMMVIRVSADTDHSDLWKAGYHAGFFASLYGVLYRWTVSSDWTLGEIAHVQYHIDCIRRAL
jgi:hypothetical protein